MNLDTTMMNPIVPNDCKTSLFKIEVQATRGSMQVQAGNISESWDSGQHQSNINKKQHDPDEGLAGAIGRKIWNILMLKESIKKKRRKKHDMRSS